MLFLGRLSAKKSPDLLLEAFAKLPLPEARNNTRLVFVGPDESGMKAQLSQMAARLGVASQVLFCGPLFNVAKWEAYRDADVFVLPSQNENFGNTAAEATAAGTPVVITENCGIAPLLAGAQAWSSPKTRRPCLAPSRECSPSPNSTRNSRRGASNPPRGSAGRSPRKRWSRYIANLSTPRAACHNHVPEAVLCSSENFRSSIKREIK